MFKEEGYMYQLWQYCHLYKSVIFDCFDFLLSKNDKAEWICAVKDGVTNADVSPFKLLDFPGGLYAMAVSIDESRNVMFNMPYLYEDGRDIAYRDIEKGLGYKQMQRYFPIKLKI